MLCSNLLSIFYTSILMPVIRNELDILAQQNASYSSQAVRPLKVPHSQINQYLEWKSDNKPQCTGTESYNLAGLVAEKRMRDT